MMVERAAHTSDNGQPPEFGSVRALTKGRLLALACVIAGGAAALVLLCATIALEPWWGPATRKLSASGYFVKSDDAWALMQHRTAGGTRVDFERREREWPTNQGLEGPYLTIRRIEYSTAEGAGAPDRRASIELIESFFVEQTPYIRPGDTVSVREWAVDLRFWSTMRQGAASGWYWVVGLILFLVYCAARLTFLCDRYRSVRRLRRGLCPSCAYPMAGGTDAVCPECGGSPVETIGRLTARKRGQAAG